ncbi:MAG: histidine kinase [Arcobacter sp.]|nr:MAG: histidine kinase [Arcobacter sp.]
MPFLKKKFSFAQNIPMLQKHISILENEDKAIIERWLKYTQVSKVLQKHDIDLNNFKKIYAKSMFENFIAIVKMEQELGPCTSLSKFLNVNRDKAISISNLYVIWAHFEKSVISHFFSLKIMNAELYDEVSYVFERNFEGTLSSYQMTIFQIEQEIEEHKQIFNQYNMALDQSALVLKTDLNGIVTYVNPKFVAVSGYSEEEFIGKNNNLIRHPDMAAEFFSNMWNHIKIGNTFRGNIKNKKKDGSSYYVDTTILPLYDINHDMKEYLSVQYEVTDLVRARDYALEAEKTKDIFLANMSHEIRTPLNAILGFVDVLRGRIKDTKNKEYLEIVHKSGHSLLTIISDILDFAKLRSGQVCIHKESCDLVHELRLIISLFTEGMVKKDINFEYFIDTKLPSIANVDTVRINQIFSNFLSNAMKFTPEKGRVSIHFSLQEHIFKLSVTDSGEGMNEEQQSRIFNAFEQAKETTTKTHGGTGLGLAICLKLAQQMDGNIILESVPDRGSIFTLEIPIEYDEESLSDFSKDKRPQIASSQIEDKLQFNGHILVAEDNASNQLLITILLKEFGLSLDIANNGKEAYEMYEKNKDSQDKVYDLILMDNQMPILNGIEATKKIREIEEANNFQKIIIVALTANALKGDRERFIKSGLDDYLKKPIDVKALEKVLNKYLQKK